MVDSSASAQHPAQGQPPTSSSTSTSSSGKHQKSKEEDVVEVEFTQPTSLLDLEARQKAAQEVEDNGGPDPLWVDTNPVATDNEDGYIGTDPIYYDRANETDEPLPSEDGPEAVAEEAYVNSFEKPDHEAAAAEKKTEAEKADSK